MYSIPPKQFAIPEGVPHIFPPIINRLQRAWKRYHPAFSNEEGVGVYFLDVKGAFLLWKHTPLSFLNQRGGGYIYD